MFRYNAERAVRSKPLTVQEKVFDQETLDCPDSDIILVPVDRPYPFVGLDGKEVNYVPIVEFIASSYGIVDPIERSLKLFELIVVISATDEVKAKMHNRIMHALNGNIDAQNLWTPFPLEPSFELEQANIMANIATLLAEMEAEGVEFAELQGDDLVAFEHSDWQGLADIAYNNDGWSAAEAASHNVVMHSLNGNNPNKKITSEKKMIKAAEKKITKLDNKLKSELKVARKAVKAKQVSKGKSTESSSKIAKDFQTVALGMMMPEICRVPRMKSIFNLKETAEARPHNVVALDMTAGSGINNPRGDGSFFGAAFRNPLRSAVIWDANTEGHQASYVAKFIDANGIQSTTVNDFPADSDWTILPLVNFDYSSGTKFHGDVIYPGRDLKYSGDFFWMDAGADDHEDYLRVLFTAPDASATATFQTKLVKWENGKIFSGPVTTTAVGTAQDLSYTAALGSGYYCFMFRWNGGAQSPVDFSSMSLNFSDSGHYCHLPLSQIATRTALVQDYRISAFSLLYTNTASPAYANGQVAMAQVAGSVDWYTIGNFDSIAAQIDSWHDKAATGAYGYAKITNPKDFDMKSCFVSANGILEDAFYPLVDDHDYLIFAGDVPQELGRSGFVVATHAIEYRTTDLWAETRRAETSTVAYNKAVEWLATQPQFFENPLHIKEIAAKVLNGAKAGLNFVVQNGPKLLDVAKILGSFL